MSKATASGGPGAQSAVLGQVSPKSIGVPEFGELGGSEESQSLLEFVLLVLAAGALAALIATLYGSLRRGRPVS